MIMMQFKEMYADIYYVRYPSGVIESPLCAVNQQMARSKGKWGRRRGASPAAALRGGPSTETAGSAGHRSSPPLSARTMSPSEAAAASNSNPDAPQPKPPSVPSLLARVLYGASFRRVKLRPEAAAAAVSSAPLATSTSVPANSVSNSRDPAAPSSGALQNSEAAGTPNASAFSEGDPMPSALDSRSRGQRQAAAAAIVRNQPLRPATASVSVSVNTQHVATAIESRHQQLQTGYVSQSQPHSLKRIIDSERGVLQLPYSFKHNYVIYKYFLLL